MNTTTLETRLSTLIRKLRTQDFPGYGTDAIVWVRGGYPHLQIEVLPAGTGALAGTVAVYRFRNLFDDGAKVGAYKTELLAALPEIAEKVRTAMETEPGWQPIHRQARYEVRQRAKGEKKISLRLDQDAVAALEKRAAEHGGSQSATIRALLMQ